MWQNIYIKNNKNKLKKLESVIHPLLKQKLKQKIRKLYKKTDILFIDAALIFEMNWDKYCDYIIHVPSSSTPTIQESHIMIGHIICALVEEAIFSKVGV